MFLKILKSSYGQCTLLLFMAISLYSHHSAVYAQNDNDGETSWILERLSYDRNELEIPISDLEELTRSRIRLNKNVFYLNDQIFTVKEQTTNDIASLFAPDFLQSTSYQNNIEFLNSLIYEEGAVHYLQFAKAAESPLERLLLPQSRVIYSKNTIVFLGKGFFIAYAKPEEKRAFKIQSKSLPLLELPIDINTVYDFILENGFSANNNISQGFLRFLEWPADNDFSANGAYFQVSDLSGIRLPKINDSVQPIIINGQSESGELISYLYLFADDFKMIDKVVLFDYETTTRDGPGGDGLTVGHRYFAIDKFYNVEVWQRFNNEAIEIKRYKIAASGQLYQVPVLSACYSKSAPKDKNVHSSNSFLLTPHRANDYLRIDYRLSTVPESMERIFNNNALVISLNATNKQLCLNYQRAYPAIVKQADSRQFFGDKKRYQRQVANFADYGIDIRQRLEFIELSNIAESELAPLLLNGNQAIYMNKTLFLVGDDFFVAYKQPTKEQLSYDAD